MERTVTAQANARVPFRHAAQFFRRPPLGIFGERMDERGPSARLFRSNLVADAPGGLAMTHAVDIEILAVRAEDERVEVDLSWSPTGGTALLPGLVGTLRASKGSGATTDIELEGTYHVPLGPLGRFGDGVAGHRLARRSIAELLERIAARVEERALETSTKAHVAPAPYPPDLRREHRSGSVHR